MRLSVTILPKIIFALCISAAALGISYYFSNRTFGHIDDAMEELSNPLEKLKAINKLSATVSGTNRAFNELLTTGSSQSFHKFYLLSKQLELSVDSLQQLVEADPVQVVLTDSIAFLMRERNLNMIAYFHFRQSMLNDADYKAQFKQLDTLLKSDNIRNSIIIERNQSRVTKAKIDTIEKVVKRGFFARLFSKKKSNPSVTISENTTQGETVDTTIRPADKAIAGQAQNLMKNIRNDQLTRQAQLLSYELKMNRMENIFNEKITAVISDIEKDMINQTHDTQDASRISVGNHLHTIQMILYGFMGFAVIMLGWVLADISKSNRYRKALELSREEAHRQSEARQNLLSNISHELRTPLQSVIGFAEQLQHQPGNHGFMDAIQSSANHLLDVVNEVLDYSRLDAGKFIFAHTSFRLQDAIQEVFNMMQPQAADKDLTLHLQHNMTGTEWVSGDRYRLKQILLNLMGNAIKYTENGQVELIADVREESQVYTVLLEVKDTGPGIIEDLQETIFNQFDQGTNAIAGSRSGSGLGLSITRALVEAQGGNIKLESKVGSGSTFIIHMNMEKGTPQGTNIENITHPTQTTSTVWVLDDDALIRNLCSQMLKKHNINHRIFSDAASLMLATEIDLPTMLLLDIRMPDISGAEICRKIRSTIGENIFIIAITAQALPEETKALLHAGFDRVLCKPFREAEFLNVLHHEAPGETYESNLPSGMLSGLDAETVKAIMKQYVSETQQDIALLEKALQVKDANLSADLLHRIAGRSMQSGLTDYGLTLRNFEVWMRENPDEIIPITEIKKILFELKQWMKSNTLSEYA